MDNKNKIKRYLIIFFTIIVALFVYKIYSILTPFFICALLIYVLAPIVNYLSKKTIFGKNLSRGYSVIIIYLMVIGILSVSSFVIFPLAYGEGKKIASDIPKQISVFKNDTLPVLLSNLQDQLDGFGVEISLQQEFDKSIDSFFSSGQMQIKSIPKYAQKFAAGFFSTLTSLIVIFIFTAFILIDLPKIKEKGVAMIPAKYHQGIFELSSSINKDLNGAIRGQLIICVVNGILTSVGLLLLKVKFAITLGIIAAIFSLIPIFGTIFSLVPTVLVSLTQSWVSALECLILIMLVHLIEANLLNPKIMGTSVELHPSIIIFSIFVGEALFGVPGLLLAVPFVAIIRSILIFIYNRYFIEDNTNTEILIESNLYD
ncbi:MAG: AI-2E family transporter [Candidatus Sericytochromatia bacterium]|nr:AI-2E family transporter [Candidatus Sericytochromatia bacterium]